MTSADRVTIYHNPACSKSREALALIRATGGEPHIVEYLKTPPSADELATIVKKLGIYAQALVRKGESLFKEEHAGKDLSDAQWIEVMVPNPVLIERPIVVRGDVAVLGRPPENVRRLLT